MNRTLLVLLLVREKGFPLEWIARITFHIPRKGAKHVISFKQSSVIRRILEHLELWENPRSPSEPLRIVCEPDADYVPLRDKVPKVKDG